MTGTGAALPAPALPAWGLRLAAPAGHLPLGAIFGGIGALAAAAVVVLRLDRLPFSVCVFKALTGLPCPTCGSTRAVAHLVRLDLVGALAMNPLTTVAAGVMAAWVIADLGLLARGRALDLSLGPALARALRAGVMAAVVVNWAYLMAAGR